MTSKDGESGMQIAIQWFWKNIFIIGIIVIEVSLCFKRPRRRHALVKWLCFTGALLAASSLLTHTWQWEGDLIRRENLLGNTVWRVVLVYLSSVQVWLCFDADFWNAIFITQVAAACQTAQFSVYKLVEAMLLGIPPGGAVGI